MVAVAWWATISSPATTAAAARPAAVRFSFRIGIPVIDALRPVRGRSGTGHPDRDARCAQPEGVRRPLGRGRGKVGGFEVLKKIRSHPDTRLLPVVILTAHADEGVERAARGAGENLPKPVKLIESPLNAPQLQAIMQGNARRLLPRA